MRHAYPWAVLLCVVAAPACDSDPTCAVPSGTYEVDYVQIDGDCGDIPTRIVEASTSRTTSFAAPCAGTVHWSDDFCEASFDATCPRDDVGPGFHDQQHSESTYSQDAAFRTGSSDVTIFAAD